MVCLSSFQLQGYYGTPLERAAANGCTEVVALLLQVEGIDVNKEVSITILTHTMSSSHPTITNPHHFSCGMSFQLQGINGTPLAVASENGHTEVVTLLLQVEGIDVNKGVSIMIPISTLSSSHPTTTNPYYYWCGMSFLFPITGDFHPSYSSLEEWSH